MTSDQVCQRLLWVSEVVLGLFLFLGQVGLVTIVPKIDGLEGVKFV